MVRLGDVCKIIGGYAFKSEEFITDGVPVIRISNLDGETVNVDKNVCYSVEFLKNNNNFTVRKNDILMAMSGATVGKIGVYQNEDVALLNQRVCNLKPIEDKLNREYLNCYCHSDYFKSEILKNAFGCAQPNISVKQIADFEIKILDLKSQVRIANKLKKILCLIEKRKQQLQKLDELVKARFVEMFGDESEFYKWQCTTVGEVANVFVGIVIKPTQYYAEQGIPAFRSLNIGALSVKNKDWIYFSEEGHLENSRTIVRTNDVLVVRSGAPGTSCVVTEEFDGYNAIDIIIARPDNTKINSTFLAMFTNMPHGMLQIKEGVGGAAQQHFNIGKYKGLKIILPSLELQNQFAVFVEQIDKSKLYVQKSLEKMEMLKKALMQKYFG